MYLQDLAMIPAIKESGAFKKFLEIERQCPEHTITNFQSIIELDFNSQTREMSEVKSSSRYLTKQIRNDENQQKLISELFKPAQS